MTVLLAVAALLLPPLPQNQAYHEFADQRTLLGIPHFLNVVSNLPFILVGAAGLFFLWDRRIDDVDSSFITAQERWPYIVFFIGLLLTGPGSAYYHLAPDNARLVWDRLPMTLLFTAFFAAFIAERISVRAGLSALPFLVAAGVASVFYWHWSELRGAGDLRPYLFVQFYPLLVIPCIAWFFPSRYSQGRMLLEVIALYGAAKVCEVLDGAIYSLGDIVSGHTLKHLAAALAAYWLLRMLRRRQPDVY